MAETNNPPARRQSQILRLFSTDSTRSSTDATDGRCMEIQKAPQWNHSFKSREFLLKIAQLVVAVICTGLYSKGMLLIRHSITSAMFPNVVFSAFIIITSVITISYVLGHVMHDILIRIFNALGAILYFVAGTITGHFWLILGRHLAEEGPKQWLYSQMLIFQIILTFFNSFLYGLDLYFNVKRTLKELE